MDHQVIRHKLMDMRMRIESTRAWLDTVTLRADTNDKGAEWIAQVCLLKNYATRTMQFCADAAVQISAARTSCRARRPNASTAR